MTDDERDELERLQSFIDLLGVSETTDAEFARYLELLQLERAS